MLVVAAAVVHSGSASSSQPVGAVRAATDVGFSTFDPFNANAASIDYLRPVYDTLVVKSGLDEYEPGLSTHYRYLTPTEFYMKLRSGVYLGNGERLDADLVRKNFEHGMGLTGTPWLGFYQNIASVDAVSKDEIVLSLKQPDPALLESLQKMPGMMVSATALSEPGLMSRKPMGVGPWYFDERDSILGQKHIYTKSDTYWDYSDSTIDRYVVQLMPDSTARINALRTGQIELAAVQSNTASLLGRYGFKVVAVNSVIKVLQIADAHGENVPALADGRVRRAIGLAVNRKAVLKVLFGGHGYAGANLYPKGVVGYSELLDREEFYDPERAKRLMKEAGFSEGFEVNVVVQPHNSKYATVIAGELAKIGIRLDITVMPDSGSWLSAYQKGRSPLGLLSQQITPPHSFWSSFIAKTGHYNPFRLHFPQIDEIADVAASQSESNSEVLRDLYASMFEIVLHEESLIFPIVVADLVVAMDKSLSGDMTKYSTAGLPDPRALYLEEQLGHEIN